MLSNVYARNIFLSFKFSHLFLKINCLELFKGEIAKTAQHLNSYLTLFFFSFYQLQSGKGGAQEGNDKESFWIFGKIRKMKEERDIRCLFSSPTRTFWSIY